MNEPLGALIQLLEVDGELNGGVSTEMRKWSEADLRCSIDKKEKHLTRGDDGAAEERRWSPHRRACCWPFTRRKKGRLRFLEKLEEEEGEESSGRWKSHNADGVIYRPK